MSYIKREPKFVGTEGINVASAFSPLPRGLLNQKLCRIDSFRVHSAGTSKPRKDFSDQLTGELGGGKKEGGLKRQFIMFLYYLLTFGTFGTCNLFKQYFFRILPVHLRPHFYKNVKWKKHATLGVVGKSCVSGFPPNFFQRRNNILCWMHSIVDKTKRMDGVPECGMRSACRRPLCRVAFLYRPNVSDCPYICPIFTNP